MRPLTVALEIRNAEVFGWVGDWLAHQRYGEACRRLSVDLLRLHDISDRDPRPTLVFAPGRGTQLFIHGRRWFWLERGVEPAESGPIPKQREYYAMRAWAAIRAFCAGSSPRPLLFTRCGGVAGPISGRPTATVAGHGPKWHRRGRWFRHGPRSALMTQQY